MRLNFSWRLWRTHMVEIKYQTSYVWNWLRRFTFRFKDQDKNNSFRREKRCSDRSGSKIFTTDKKFYRKNSEKESHWLMKILQDLKIGDI